MSPDITGFKRYLALNDKKPSTIRRNLERLKRAFTFLKAFDKPSVDEYVADLKLAGKTNEYINIIIYTLRSYAQYTNSCLELQKYHPLKEKKKSNRTTLSSEEVEAFLSLPCQKGWHKEKYKMWQVFWEICLTCGIRMGECANLVVNSVDFGLGVLHLDGKTGKRDTPIPQILIPNLKEYISTLKDDYLFPSGSRTKRKTVNDTDWGADWHKRINVLGIKRDNLVPYSSRHTFGTLLGAEDVNLYTIKELMGHSNITTTEQYMHGNLKTMKKGQSKLPYIAKNSNPCIQLNHWAETIRSLNMQGDKRFTCHLEETGDSITFKVCIKDPPA